MVKIILAVLIAMGALAASGCAARPGADTPVVSAPQLSPVPPPVVKGLSSPDLESFKESSEQNVKTAEGEQDRRQERKIARWIYIVAGIAALAGLAGLVGFFLPYPWLAPFKPLLGEIGLIAGGSAIVLFYAATKVHTLLAWLPWVVLGVLGALAVRFASKYGRTATGLGARLWAFLARAKR